VFPLCANGAQFYSLSPPNGERVRVRGSFSASERGSVEPVGLRNLVILVEAGFEG